MQILSREASLALVAMFRTYLSRKKVFDDVESPNQA